MLIGHGEVIEECLLSVLIENSQNTSAHDFTQCRLPIIASYLVQTWHKDNIENDMRCPCSTSVAGVFIGMI
jgi:hypothetical protein